MEPLRKAYRNAVGIGAAMIASLFIYAVLVEVLKRQQVPFGSLASFPEIKWLSTLLYVLALLQIVVIRIVQRLLWKKRATDDLPSLIARLNACTMVTYALCEAPAIYGLVLFLLGGLYRDFYLLLAYSLLLQLAYFPRYGRWEEWVRSTSGFTG
ncbi:MAG: hypothetical protein QHH30_03585 [candidate division NC10 bacterium]|nr:hypothetical protein [candidate division NC10 bacterium]